MWRGRIHHSANKSWDLGQCAEIWAFNVVSQVHYSPDSDLQVLMARQGRNTSTQRVPLHLRLMTQTEEQNCGHLLFTATIDKWQHEKVGLRVDAPLINAMHKTLSSCHTRITIVCACLTTHSTFLQLNVHQRSLLHMSTGAVYVDPKAWPLLSSDPRRCASNPPFMTGYGDDTLRLCRRCRTLIKRMLVFYFNFLISQQLTAPPVILCLNVSQLIVLYTAPWNGQ